MWPTTRCARGRSPGGGRPRRRAAGFSSAGRRGGAPVRAVTLAWRALPAPLRRWLSVAGPYGRAAALWGAGDRRGALTALEARPARLAAFSLAVDQPAVARSALACVSDDNPA